MCPDDIYHGNIGNGSAGITAHRHSSGVLQRRTNGIRTDIQALRDSGTLRAIPDALLFGPSRWALVAVAHFSEIYAYHPLGRELDEFKIWIEALAPVRPGRDGRVWLDDWRANWRTYYRLCVPTARVAAVSQTKQ